MFSGKGAEARIVDIIWDQKEKNEPGNTIKFAKAYLKKSGFVKVTCWGTMHSLRKALKKNRFMDRGETPRFSTFSASHGPDLLSDGNNMHFVEGDGDSEYLV